MGVIHEFIDTVTASVKEAVRSIGERYNKWKERLRQRKKRKEYIEELIQAAIPYNAEAVDEKLATECRSLINQFFPDGVEQQRLELEVEERMELISKLTNEVAKLMNVKIDNIKFFTSQQGSCCGFYNYNESLIAINSDFIKYDHPEIIREVINTVFHECKHARQYFAVVEGVDYGYSKELLQSWYRNIHDIISSEESDEAYRKQPLERDAFGFANSIIKA